MHVYDDRFHTIQNAIIRLASADEYRRVCAELGIERMVVVQPSGYGFDNSCTLDAMAQFGSVSRGIVVIAPETSDGELQRLHALGVRGVRYMMIVPGGLSWDSMAAMADRVGPMGWNLNLQFDGHQLPDKVAALRDLPIDLVIDHFGSFHGGVKPEDPAFLALLSLMEAGRTWIKLSAPYSYKMSAAPHYEEVALLARLLSKKYPDRCLWASNWPHPGESSPPATVSMLSLLEEWVPDESIRRRILVDNPAKLYGF